MVIHHIAADGGTLLPPLDAPFLVGAAQRHEVDRLIADGLLETLVPGVAGPVGCGRDAAVRLAALAAALPGRARDRAVVAQAAAAWLWCGGATPVLIDLVVAPGLALPRLAGVAVHERRMPDHDVTELPLDGGGRLAVTTATRTVADLLRLLPEDEAVAAAAPLAALPGVTAVGLAACLERMPRARGVSRARRLAAGLTDRAEVSRSACP